MNEQKTPELITTCELVKLVDYTRMWKGKDGKERPSVSYYARSVINGKIVSVSIDCHYKQSARDWNTLDMLCRIVVKRADEVTK